eukprot:6690341-Prymnesium_polylepis.2
MSSSCHRSRLRARLLNELLECKKRRAATLEYDAVGHPERRLDALAIRPHQRGGRRHCCLSAVADGSQT